MGGLAGGAPKSGPSNRGRRRGPARSERGFVLLDALVALTIILIGFAVFLGGIGLAGSMTVKQSARVKSIIEQRNAHAADRTILFERK